MNRIAYGLLYILPEILIIAFLLWWFYRERRDIRAWRKHLSDDGQQALADVEARMNGKTYVIGAHGRWIKCLTCRMTSHHPEDVAQKYCGNCHKFHKP